MIQAIILTNNDVIIAQVIPEIDSDTGESQFNLMYPYLLTFEESQFNLSPWLNHITESTENFILYPDKILTMKEPKSDILKHYKKLVLFDENKILKNDEVKPVRVSSSDRDKTPDVLPEMTISDRDIDEVFIEEE